MSAVCRLYTLAHAELFDGAAAAQVVAALRAQARVPGQPPTRLLFLEPVSALRRGRAEALAACRGMWPEGRISVVPFLTALGEGSAGRFLAARLWHERLGRAPLVFHCRGPQAVRSAYIARRLLGRGRIVFELRADGAGAALRRLAARGVAPAALQARRAAAAARAADRRAALIADQVVALSPGLAHYATAKLGATAAAVTVVPACVEEITFHRRDRRGIRAGWGVTADDTPVLAAAGPLGPERLPDLMVQLLAAVRSRRPDARLVLLGDVAASAALPPLLAAAGLPPEAVVRPPLPREQAAAALGGADVALLFEPAPGEEGCREPGEVAAALAAGLALAVTPGAGRVHELVREEGLGWVVPREGGAGLEQAAAGIAAAAGDGARRERCLDVCRRDYLWRRHLLALRHAYRLPWEVPSAAGQGPLRAAQGDPVA